MDSSSKKTDENRLNVERGDRGVPCSLCDFGGAEIGHEGIRNPDRSIGLLVLFSMATAFADVFLGQGLIDAGFSETAEKGEVQVQAQLQMLPIALLETLMLDTVCYGLAKFFLVRRMRKLNTIKNKTEV